MRTAIINEAGLVINVIEADAEYTPDEGTIAVASSSADIGFLYANGSFTSPVISSAKLRAELIGAANVALLLTDRVAMRCLKNGVQVPTEWLDYYKNVLAISNGTDTSSTILPAQPSFPSGT